MQMQAWGVEGDGEQFPAVALVLHVRPRQRSTCPEVAVFKGVPGDNWDQVLVKDPGAI